MDAAQAARYISDYLREHEVDDHAALAERLIELLLKDPEHEQVRDLAKTPRSCGW